MVVDKIKLTSNTEGERKYKYMYIDNLNVSFSRGGVRARSEWG